MHLSTQKKQIIDQIEKQLGKKLEPGKRRRLHKSNIFDLTMNLTQVNLARLTGQESIAIKIPA